MPANQHPSSIIPSYSAPLHVYICVVPVEYHTVMIEVNKRLYMNEQTLEKSDTFYKLKDDIQSLYDVLLKR